MLLNILVFAVVTPVSSFIVKIPVPARVLCVAVPRRKNWSRLHARFIKRRKKLYVLHTYGQEFPVEIRPRTPVRSRESLRTEIRWRARLVYAGLSVAVPSSAFAFASLSFRSFFLRRPFQPPWPILIRQRGARPLRLLFCAHIERRGSHVAAEMWYSHTLCFITHNPQLINNFLSKFTIDFNCRRRN